MMTVTLMNTKVSRYFDFFISTFTRLIAEIKLTNQHLDESETQESSSSDKGMLLHWLICIHRRLQRNQHKESTHHKR